MDWNLPISDDLKYNSNNNHTGLNSPNSNVFPPSTPIQDTPKHFVQTKNSPNSQNIDPYDIAPYPAPSPSDKSYTPNNVLSNFSPPNAFPKNIFQENIPLENNFPMNNFSANNFSANNLTPNNINSNSFQAPLSINDNHKTIAVVGAVGGIGATLFSICLALYLSKLHRTILIDGIAGGGGLDIALGLENKTGLRMCDLVNADGQIPVERLYKQTIDYQNLKILSSNYTNPVFPTGSIFANVIFQLKNITNYTIIDIPRSKLTNNEFLKTIDNLIIISPNNISGISATSAICNLTQNTKKSLLIYKFRSFKNIKLFTNNEINNLLDIKILGFLKIDSYIKSSLQAGYPINLKKSSDIYQLIKDIIKSIK
ncbi:MAG: hypothetical protein LBT85_03590 [Bifidobacteriaceae bacterium]|jgi:MinD-like ATPase involved in chromosome partitioning or flagellar assembly|nr:hypothetical protein [Bifidobacteriaceae bacterium]